VVYSITTIPSSDDLSQKRKPRNGGEGVKLSKCGPVSKAGFRGADHNNPAACESKQAAQGRPVSRQKLAPGILGSAKRYQGTLDFLTH
ncbi:hypothetical protein AVEN_212004-1, partial [Araneus ventricosus]